MKRKLALTLLLFIMVTMLMSSLGKVNNCKLAGGPGDKDEDEDIPIEIHYIHDKWTA